MMAPGMAPTAIMPRHPTCDTMSPWITSITMIAMHAEDSKMPYVRPLSAAA